MMSPSLNGVVPIICVILGGLACMLAEAFRDKGERMPIGGLGLIGLAGAAAASILLWGRRVSSFGVVLADDFGLFICLVLVGIGILTIVYSSSVLERFRMPVGEYYALLLFSLGGMMLMAVATDLLVIFLALEVFSLAVYVLTGIRRDAPGVEGAFKYFLLGGFSSAFFLYGIAFTYGVVGSTRLDRIAAEIASGSMTGNPMLVAAIALLLVGFVFKVSAVPFHMWTPDAYEGAPTVVTGFMSTAVKAAAFAAFVRVFMAAFGPMHATWAPALGVIAALTMILGSVVGVVQSSLKRMLAYSSIAHGGYLLLALLSGGDIGEGAILFYVLVYAVTNVGAFAIIAIVGTPEEPRDQVKDFAGLWHTHPALSGLMTVFLLSLGGLPPTAGFVAKWYVFSAAIRGGQVPLAIIGVLTSVVSVFFYLRVIVMMYMTAPPEGSLAPPALSKSAMVALAFSAVVVFYLGILPTRVLDIAATSLATLF